LYNLTPPPTNGVDSKNIEIKTFPNPTNSNLTISFSSVLNNGKVELIDQSGKIMLSKLIEESTNKIHLDTVFLPQGIYTLNVINETYSAVPMKIVILH
jgi:hypothetical protein